MKIVPAIIAKSQQEFDKAYKKIEDFVDTVHLDVMDGHFVENKSLNFDVALPDGKNFEAHLMVENVGKFTKEFLDKGVKTIIVSVEVFKTEEELAELSAKVRDNGAEFGVALKPETNTYIVERNIEHIDRVLVLTVEPGQYGAHFLPENLEKVTSLREKFPDLLLEVDGGAKRTTIDEIADTEPDLVVSGSFVMKSEKPDEAISELMEASR